ncbi:cytochrome P450 [Noviherbaspirillum sp. CPCC 100848]|uniref:Cytochrome P450 n=1 Tax=Noviherbaspirillum album TaxID=3080276 RepID=A0ABU6J244_9BURK|nr:cytochrome P450 [Noviherbaspirillum sp. CPCC 100848]MEC4717679.1 cytochrome P450 [Noviherbaspirillum sp. CPCC 100848]
MKPSTSSNCPYHADVDGTSPAHLHPPGTWPPGPPSGLTGWSLLRRMSRDLPGALAEWRQGYGDMVHLHIWPEHQVVVSDPQLVRELLVNHHDALIRWERGIQVFSQLHGHSVLIAEGQPWRSKRHTLQPNFSPKTVEAFVPAMSGAAEKAFAQWRTGDADWPIESSLTSLAMDVIVRMMFSSEIDEDARSAERAVHDTAVAGNAEMYWPARWPDWMPWKRAKRQALAVLNRLIDRHIQARLMLAPAAWPKDLLSELLALHHEDSSAWPLKAVRDECMTAFLAGHETAAATLTWWTWCMAANPQAQSTARQEIRTALQGRIPTAQDLPSLAYLTQTLQETLRLYPAAPVLLTRRSRRPITLGAWQLPARTMFTIPVQLMHHDPRWFPDPHAFRPERFAADAPGFPRGAFMPFGTGPRVCLGQHLAMAEMTIIAAMFLQRFAVTVPDEMTAPKPVFNITLRPDQPLRLKLSTAAAK